MVVTGIYMISVIKFPHRLPGEWQQCISLRTIWIRKDVTHLEVLNGQDVRTILHCVWQQLPVNVYEAYVTTGLGNRRAH